MIRAIYNNQSSLVNNIVLTAVLFTATTASGQDDPQKKEYLNPSLRQNGIPTTNVQGTHLQPFFYDNQKLHNVFEAYEYEATIEYSWETGGMSKSGKSQFTVESDSTTRQTRIRLKNQDREIELFRDDKFTLLRHNDGHWRQVRMTGQELERWYITALSAPRQAIDPSLHRLALTASQNAKFGGQDVTRFKLVVPNSKAGRAKRPNKEKK